MLELTVLLWLARPWSESVTKVKEVEEAEKAVADQVKANDEDAKAVMK